MITYIIDERSEVHIGPLNLEEATKVKQILNKHNNKFSETQVLLHFPGILMCSYKEFLEQVSKGNLK